MDQIIEKIKQVQQINLLLSLNVYKNQIFILNYLCSCTFNRELKLYLNNTLKLYHEMVIIIKLNNIAILF